MSIVFKKLSDDRFAIPIKIIVSYLLWKLFYHFADMNGTALGMFWDRLTFAFGREMASVTTLILQIFGMHVASSGTLIHLLESGKDVSIEEHCLAIPASVVFVISILSFKGSFKDKLWFISLGLFGIQLINLIRVSFLAWVLAYRPAAMFILHHSVVTVGVTYGLIFLMVIWWMRRNTGIKTTELPV